MLILCPAPYPWYINPPIHGILTPLPMVYWPPTHGISTPQPMVSWPPAHGISTSLPMVYQTLLWYYELLSFGRNEGSSIYHEGIQNTMTKNWPLGQNIICKILDSTIKDVKKSFKIVDRTSGACFTFAILISLIDRKASYSEPVSYGILNPMVNWPGVNFIHGILNPLYRKLTPPCMVNWTPMVFWPPHF